MISPERQTAANYFPIAMPDIRSWAQRNSVENSSENNHCKPHATVPLIDLSRLIHSTPTKHATELSGENETIAAPSSSKISGESGEKTAFS